jgi:hypothetical protein
LRLHPLLIPAANRRFALFGCAPGFAW